RCGKVLPLACRTYQEKLPDHYTNVVHRNKLSQAMRVFSQHARGPAYEHFADQLQEECERFWHHNRRLCEVVSLTGNHCIHPLHIVPGTKEESVAEQNKDETSPPIMHHASHNKSTCTCNCGRKQAQREDPFDIKSANYDFFQNLEPKCCGVLEHWKFPVFQPSEDETLEPKEISALDVNPHIPIHKTESNASSTEQGRAETQPCALSIALSLGQSGGSEIFGGHGSDNSSADGMLDILSVSDVTHIVHKDKQQPRRQASTTEYLADTSHDSHVRAYIGDEYECPRGVRFICSGPDKMLKVTGSSNIKDTANRLVTMDMPLYFPCPCRSAKSHRAQLMRVFIVCPDGPVHIRLNPRVQPGSVTAPIYNTGVGDDGIVLPTNALWTFLVAGLDQPGFLHGSSFLLPWDIPIPSEAKSEQNWPAPSEGGRRGGKKMDKRAQKDMIQNG
uniref:Nonsense-mediated mRNA decay factor SMG8 n=1 Tax=Saccoglossus kowalevskii TaxID=10224 RepID=A0ABM0MJ96_SACKO